ncbi:hypothetical protein Vi05172_g10493 [Venturia inaequalis]|uniref:Uncharacterized protein n=1 Tax=Venturia inaequalis TaxID=5025 RepID=A0A8H3Z9C0_VENIN|nr:hypothetical protein EG327_000642 [Venturia inaequalis]RDI79482.1 hypothetical protein Vi05172_g10493 [Venturia inaequalis]
MTRRGLPSKCVISGIHNFLHSMDYYLPTINPIKTIQIHDPNPTRILASLIPAEWTRYYHQSKPITQERLQTLPREILHKILYHTYDDFTVPSMKEAEILNGNFLDKWLTQSARLDLAKQAWTAVLEIRYPALKNSIVYTAQKVYIRIDNEEAERLGMVRKIQRAKFVARDSSIF